MTLSIAGVQTAGWKRKLLIGLFFAFAAISLLVSIAWMWIKPYAPKLSAILADVATNPVSWFVVIILALIAAIIKKPRPPVNQPQGTMRNRQVITQVAAPMPPPSSPIPPNVTAAAKPTFSPNYANYMNDSLRRIRNIIEGSVRDQTSIPMFFKSCSGQSFSAILENLEKLENSYRTIKSDVEAIRYKDRSYEREILPFIESIYLDKQFEELIGVFRGLLRMLKENVGIKMDSNSMLVVKWFGEKTSKQYQYQQNRSSNDIKKIDAKLAEINSH